MKLPAKNERLEDDATLEQSARGAARTQAAAALPKVAQLAAEAIVPAVSAAVSPGARTEAALRRALMLGQFISSTELKAFVGADVGDAPRDAFTAALK